MRQDLESRGSDLTSAAGAAAVGAGIQPIQGCGDLFDDQTVGRHGLVADRVDARQRAGGEFGRVVSSRSCSCCSSCWRMVSTFGSWTVWEVCVMTAPRKEKRAADATRWLTGIPLREEGGLRGCSARGGTDEPATCRGTPGRKNLVPGTGDVRCARHHGGVETTLRGDEAEDPGHGQHHSRGRRKGKSSRVAFTGRLAMVRAWQPSTLFSDTTVVAMPVAQNPA